MGRFRLLPQDPQGVHVTSCRQAQTPSPQTSSWHPENDDSFDDELHSIYRRCVGKLQWLVPLRPDLAFTVKELARHLDGPRLSDIRRLKHLRRYIKGTLDLALIPQANLQLDSTVKNEIDITSYVDANWAGCPDSRKSTSGTLTSILGCPVTFSSKTQQVFALCSAKSELYAIGSGIADALHLRSLLREAQIASKIQITVFMDSSEERALLLRMVLQRRLDTFN